MVNLGFFSKGHFEKSPVMTIQDSDFHFEDHVESHHFKRAVGCTMTPRR